MHDSSGLKLDYIPPPTELGEVLVILKVDEWVCIKKPITVIFESFGFDFGNLDLEIMLSKYHFALEEDEMDHGIPLGNCKVRLVKDGTQLGIVQDIYIPVFGSDILDSKEVYKLDEYRLNVLMDRIGTKNFIFD
jgi:hypothetical protein